MTFKSIDPSEMDLVERCIVYTPKSHDQRTTDDRADYYAITGLRKPDMSRKSDKPNPPRYFLQVVPIDSRSILDYQADVKETHKPGNLEIGIITNLDLSIFDGGLWIMDRYNTTHLPDDIHIEARAPNGVKQLIPSVEAFIKNRAVYLAKKHEPTNGNAQYEFGVPEIMSVEEMINNMPPAEKRDPARELCKRT